LGALDIDFSFKRINVSVPQKPINTPTYFILVIFSLIMITEIRKIKIGARVVMIALFIGVELYKPLSAVIMLRPIPKKAQIIINLKSLNSIFSFFRNKEINQKHIAAPTTLQYNNALGDNTSGINSFAIVWLNPKIEVAAKAAKRAMVLLFIKIY
tara:strand:+ start:39 stop:503 length:465 start_codon:yes stop_codon:yes gene_type:complete